MKHQFILQPEEGVWKTIVSLIWLQTCNYMNLRRIWDINKVGNLVFYANFHIGVWNEYSNLHDAVLHAYSVIHNNYQRHHHMP